LQTHYRGIRVANANGRVFLFYGFAYGGSGYALTDAAIDLEDDVHEIVFEL
jgi:hypothetical protein